MRGLTIRKNTITDRSGEVIERYLKDVSKYKLLDSDEEAVIATESKTDPKALDKLVRANLKFVISVAKKYQGFGVPLADLISEGNLGLVQAAQKFDPTKGFKFISYAVWHIRKAILLLLNESKTVRLPINKSQIIRKMIRTIESLTQDLSREPIAEEIANAMEISAEEVELYLSIDSTVVSLDKPISEDSDFTIEIADETTQPDERYINDSLTIEINRVLSKLKPSMRMIVEYSFGLNGNEQLTPAEISQIVGLGTERIRQIREQGVRSLRNRLRGNRELLKTFL